MTKTDWKVGDEVASTDGSGKWFIHRIDSITPSGLLKIGKHTLLYPSLKRRGGGGWSGVYYREVTDEIRKKVRRQWLVQQLNRASWHNLPTETLEAVHETLKRCKDDAAAAGE